LEKDEAVQERESTRRKTELRRGEEKMKNKSKDVSIRK
tara:strand:+ start:1293 stop:1406 length:114 start_codon:yes stop_codon:yes gene_type:complete